MMLGLLIVSDDGEVACAIVPSALDSSVVILTVKFFDIELPPIPLPVAQLRAALEVWFGKV